jgi:hypothetical protein
VSDFTFLNLHILKPWLRGSDIVTLKGACHRRCHGSWHSNWLASFLPSSGKAEAGRLLILPCKLRSRSMLAASGRESFPRVDRVWLESHYLSPPYSSAFWPTLTVYENHMALKRWHTILTPRGHARLQWTGLHPAWSLLLYDRCLCCSFFDASLLSLFGAMCCAGRPVENAINVTPVLRELLEKHSDKHSSTK